MTEKNIIKNLSDFQIYFLGLIGMIIYYFVTAPSFLVGILGVFKAIAWPAFLLYEVYFII